MSSSYNDPSKVDAMKQLRGEITRIDEQLLQLLADRRRLSHAVAATKDLNTAVIRDPVREEDLLVNLIQNGRSRGLDAHFVTRVFHEIIDDSVRIQQEYFQRAVNQDGEPAMRVAVQGIEGSYSALAAKKHLSRQPEGFVLVECQRYAEVIAAVEQGRADLGLLPIENTNSGGLGEVYDLLLQTNLHIVGEEKFEIRYCLLSPQIQPLAHLKKIYCHAQAAAQCSAFLSKLPHCTIEYYSDSAMSVRRLKEEGISEYAAIASEEAAQLYGLQVLSTQIANSAHTFTRYIAVARKPSVVDQRIPCKTSIVMATHHKAGALLESLQVFRDFDVNLTKLESRPIEGNPWEELFYVDFDGNLADPVVQQALHRLGSVTRFLKVLGCYPTGDLDKTQPPRRRVRPTGAARDKEASTLLAAPVARSMVQIRDVRIGGEPVFWAGPDSRASMSQLSRIARVARDGGANILRFACSNAMGDPLRIDQTEDSDLAMAKETADGYGLLLMAEVGSQHELERVSRYADILQVGAWNMRNAPLLRELGRQPKPVLIYRNIASGIDEFLEAAQTVRDGGNRQIVLCDAGTKRFDGSNRTMLDPASLIEASELSACPVVVDLRHAGADTEQRLRLAASLRSLSIAGLVMGTDLSATADDESLTRLGDEIGAYVAALEGTSN